MNKHTPGQWVIGQQKFPQQREIRGNQLDLVCRINEGSEHADGNARLISAAPDLYLALKSMDGIMVRAESVASGNPEYNSIRMICDAARIAIAKAEGE